MLRAVTKVSSLGNRLKKCEAICTHQPTEVPPQTTDAALLRSRHMLGSGHFPPGTTECLNRFF